MRTPTKRDKWLLLIGATRVLKGVMLLLLAAGAVKFLNSDLTTHLNIWVQRFHVDPHNRIFRKVMEKLLSLDPHTLTMIEAGTLFYAALYVTEGIGLLLQKRWAEYLTAIATASFIPLEIYELLRRFTAWKVLLLLMNSAILCYLVYLLRGKQQRQVTSPSP